MISKTQARKFCRQDISLIENYELAISDKERTWDCHHRGEVLPCGTYSRDVLKKFGLYFNRPASELIFLTHEEHARLHGENISDEARMKKAEAQRGKKHSDETKKKISEAKKGNKNHFGKKHSEESKRKMAEAHRRYWANRRATA